MENTKGKTATQLIREGRYPARFEGREALYTYLKDYQSYIDVKSLPTLKFMAQMIQMLPLWNGAHRAWPLETAILMK